MGMEGPCFHCGIHLTPLWRKGPLEKPVLCNACGSRWKTKGTLEDYIPKHGMKDDESSQPKLFPILNPGSFRPIHGVENKKFSGPSIFGHDQPSFDFGSNIVGRDQSPFVFAAGINYGPSSRLAVPENNTQTQNFEEEIQAPLFDANDVPRKKRSTLEQRVLSPIERLHQQLYIAMEEQSEIDEDDPESVLIFERINKYLPENEIGIGCMLLQPSPSPTKDSKPEPKLESSIGVKGATPAKNS